MPEIALESFKSALYDMCRPNRFKVSIQGLETDFGFNDDDYYFVKGASLPGKNMGEIDLNWQGHKYKLHGDPTFNDITITFWNNIPEGGESLRDKFENWFATTSDDANNVRGKHTEYKATVTIVQLDGDGSGVKEYNLIFAHPKELSDVELSMDSTDAVEEFTVVFSYSYVEITNGDGASVGGTGLLSGAGMTSGGGSGPAGVIGGIGNTIGSITTGLKTINSITRSAGRVINTTTSVVKSINGLKKGIKGLF